MYLGNYVINCPCGDYEILVNGLTGAVDIISREQFQALAALNNNPDDLFVSGLGSDVVKVLIERGYLFDSEEKEQDLLGQIKKFYHDTVKKDPFTFWICPTYNCNLRCPYCFEGENRQRINVMSEDQIAAAFEAMDSIADVGRSHYLNIYGGEPLLPTTTNAIESILRKADERKYLVNVISNGTHAVSFLPLLMKYRDTINFLQVTIDGIKEVHDKTRIYANGRGTFEAVTNAVDQYLDSQIPVQVRTNLSAEGVQRFPEFVRFVMNRGWTNSSNFICHFTMVNNRHCDLGNGSSCLSELESAKQIIKIRTELPEAKVFDDFDSIHVLDTLMINLGYVECRDPYPKVHFCGAASGENYLFGPDNLVYVCPSAVGQSEMSVGEFFPRLSFESNKLIVWHYDSVDELTRCRDCQAKFLCGGECTFKALQNPSDKVCEPPIEIMKALVDYQKDKILSAVK